MRNHYDFRNILACSSYLLLIILYLLGPDPSIWHSLRGSGWARKRKDSVDILRDFHLNALEEGKIESGRIAASYEMVLLPGLNTNKLTAVLFGFIHHAIC